MGYTLTKAELTSRIDSAGSVANAQDLYAGTGKFAFGELLNLELELTSSVDITVGKRFILNPCFFAASPFAIQFPFRQGWLIEYVATNTFNVSVLLGATPLLTGINATLNVAQVTTKKWKIDLLFYAVQDQFAYMQNSINNSQFFLSAGIGQGELQAGQSNVYSDVCSNRSTRKITCCKRKPHHKRSANTFRHSCSMGPRRQRYSCHLWKIWAYPPRYSKSAT